MEKFFELFDTSLKKRTDGDGMESAAVGSASVESKSYFPQPSAKKNVDISSKSKNRLIELTPKVSNVEQKKSYCSKEAKFVPYEPYKAAVKPIVPNKKNTDGGKKKPSKNNLDLSILVAQISLMDTNLSVFKKRATKSVVSNKVNRPELHSVSEEENTVLRSELESLQSEHAALKEQLTQQVQVNKELKTMLVASMGEDLETRVQSLTEDKRQLANALLSSAQHLSTHQEQTEWLAGQCEVWRSKFLASSLMVEELASWKSLLSQHIDELHLVMRQLLEEQSRVRDKLLYMYKNLQQLHENWLENISLREAANDYGLNSARTIGNINLNASKLRSTNILDLASVNFKISENLSSNFEKKSSSISNYENMRHDTDAEIAADKLLTTPLELNNKNLPLSALVGHAYAKSGGAPAVACCTHCNGQVQLL